MYATSPSIFNFITCFVMVQGEFSRVLIIDDSKSKNKENHGEQTVIHYIFNIMYQKREFDVTKEKHVE
jgi:hypothetical protein